MINDNAGSPLGALENRQESTSNMLYEVDNEPSFLQNVNLNNRNNSSANSEIEQCAPNVKFEVLQKPVCSSAHEVCEPHSLPRLCDIS